MKENLRGGYELALYGGGRDDGCGTAPSLDATHSTLYQAFLSPADSFQQRFGLYPPGIVNLSRDGML